MVTGHVASCLDSNSLWTCGTACPAPYPGTSHNLRSQDRWDSLVQQPVLVIVVRGDHRGETASCCNQPWYFKRVVITGQEKQLPLAICPRISHSLWSQDTRVSYHLRPVLVLHMGCGHRTGETASSWGLSCYFTQVVEGHRIGGTASSLNLLMCQSKD